MKLKGCHRKIYSGSTYSMPFLHYTMKKSVPWPNINLQHPNVACMIALGLHEKIYTDYRNQQPHYVHCAPAVSLSSYIQDKDEAALTENIQVLYTEQL